MKIACIKHKDYNNITYLAYTAAKMVIRQHPIKRQHRSKLATHTNHEQQASNRQQASNSRLAAARNSRTGTYVRQFDDWALADSRAQAQRALAKRTVRTPHSPLHQQ
jgi:hypothetical protein